VKRRIDTLLDGIEAVGKSRVAVAFTAEVPVAGVVRRLGHVAGRGDAGLLPHFGQPLARHYILQRIAIHLEAVGDLAQLGGNRGGGIGQRLQLNGIVPEKGHVTQQRQILHSTDTPSVAGVALLQNTPTGFKIVNETKLPMI